MAKAVAASGQPRAVLKVPRMPGDDGLRWPLAEMMVTDSFRKKDS